jgi:phosphonate transport system permease protein
MSDALDLRGPEPKKPAAAPPPRFQRLHPLAWLAWVAAAAFFLVSLQGTAWSFADLAEGLPALWRFLSKAFPPDVSRLELVLWALLETFQMALVGTVVGVLVSLPLAVLASRRHSPARPVHAAARGLIALFRVVPDLIWALIFVVTVGLGPFAGTLALAVDTIGFCGRFFAESMEEADDGPQQALRALGASRLDVVTCAVLPATLPSFINTSLFALEKAVRSSVVLGLVGAGGIGIELKVSMDMFRFDQAATIILAIFVLILGVERLSSWARTKVM